MKSSFAIECTAIENIGEFCYGNFLFWADGNCIGNQKDFTYLDACVRWVNSLLKGWDELDESTYYDLNDVEFISRSTKYEVSYSCLSNDLWQRNSRLDISHVGMTSFDGFEIFLMKNEKGNCRFVWSDPVANIFSSEKNELEVKSVFKSLVKSSI